MTAHAVAPFEVTGASSVMVIDDDDELRLAATELLRDAGYRVQLARNGRDALDQLDHAPAPDLIVLDLLMPQMDGWEFLREQQRRPDLAEVPVLVLSADRSAQMRAIDVDGYLPKPVDAQSFLRAVELRLLAGARRKLRQRAAELDPAASVRALAAEMSSPLCVVTGSLARATTLLDGLREPPSATLEHALVQLARAHDGTARIAEILRAVDGALPLPPAPRAAPEAAFAALAARRPRVLIVDDEVMLCEMLAGLLEEHCDVTWFSEPRAALAAIARDPGWDVVLSDVMMPGLGGADIYAEIALLVPALLPRIVFMTGGAFTARAQRFLATLDHEPLRKPFGRAVVLARIAQVLDALSA